MRPAPPLATAPPSEADSAGPLDDGSPGPRARRRPLEARRPHRRSRLSHPIVPRPTPRPPIASVTHARPRPSVVRDLTGLALVAACAALVLTAGARAMPTGLAHTGTPDACAIAVGSPDSSPDASPALDALQDLGRQITGSPDATPAEVTPTPCPTEAVPTHTPGITDQLATAAAVAQTATAIAAAPGATAPPEP